MGQCRGGRFQWRWQGGHRRPGPGVRSTGVSWVDVQVGDFNGDGLADIVGRADEFGQWWVGLSNGSTMFTNHLWGTWSTSVRWDDVQLGDFNNDGKMDLAGRVDESGQW